MARRDVLHDAFRSALEKDGWRVTHDPYPLPRGTQLLYVDLGAEQILAAEKDGRRIAVEIKSLLGSSEMPELERALGQYVLYRSLLKRHDPSRILYLAVTEAAFLSHFDTSEGRDLTADEEIRLVVFSPSPSEVVRWIE